MKTVKYIKVGKQGILNNYECKINRYEEEDIRI